MGTYPASGSKFKRKKRMRRDCQTLNRHAACLSKALGPRSWPRLLLEKMLFVCTNSFTRHVGCLFSSGYI